MTKRMAKKWYQSTTLWLALAQTAASVLAILVAEDPNIAALGWVGIVKSILDAVVRVFLTSKPVAIS